MGRIGLDLLAKAVDKHPQVFLLVAVVGTPDRLQEFTVGERFVRVRNKVREEVYLFGRQVRAALAASDLPLLEIDRNLA